jgi:hypothetical protein
MSHFCTTQPKSQLPIVTQAEAQAIGQEQEARE